MYCKKIRIDFADFFPDSCRLIDKHCR